MVEESQIILIVLFGMLFSAIMITGMYLFARKNKKIRELTSQLIEDEKTKAEFEKFEIAINIQEKERSVIARKLHDEVGALLSIVQKNILKLKTKAEIGEVDIDTIVYTQNFVQDSINQLRTITKNLIPHYLLKFGLAKALERMASHKAESLNVKFLFKSNINSDLDCSEVMMTHLFYITNELITNLLKHSLPTTIEMNLNLEDKNLILIITHDGIALSQRDFIALSKETENFGLENIRYRLKIIQGELMFQRFKSQGEIKLSATI